MNEISGAQDKQVATVRKQLKARLKGAILGRKLSRRIAISAYGTVKRRSFKSKEYWETRYASGGRSGAGSVGRLAIYKAEYVNSFVRKHGISSVIDFGSGDGAQLSLFDFKRYIGVDVSRTSLALCRRQYASDDSKSFYLYDAKFIRDNHDLFSAELSMSLDVIYHLVEDRVYEAYMNALFDSAQKFVLIYASNSSTNAPGQAWHVRHRKFTAWVEKHRKNWTLIEHSVNRYPLKMNEQDESFSDFYVYSKGAG